MAIVALVISIVNCLIVIATFLLNRKDKAIKDTKENHQELIEYQLNELKEDYKSMASDIKEIKKMLDNYKETFRSLVKSEMEEHIRIYHSKEN